MRRWLYVVHSRRRDKKRDRRRRFLLRVWQLTQEAAGTTPTAGQDNYRILSDHSSSVCLILPMNWCATAPSTTR